MPPHSTPHLQLATRFGLLALLSISQWAAARAAVPASGADTPGSTTVADSLAEAAAAGQLEGVVRDRATQQPVAYARIEVRGLARGAIAWRDGRFRVPGLTAGSYVVRASRVGYASAEIPDVRIKPGKTATLVIELETRETRTGPIVVRADPFAGRRDDPASEQELSYEEVRRAPGSAADVARTVQALPGVTHTSDQTSELVVRGGAPNENLTLLDDVPIPNANHFPEYGGAGGVISMLNTEIIRGVTFYSGGFPVEYGDKLSSVLEVKLRDGNRHELSGDVDVSLAGAGLLLEGPFAAGRGSWVANVRRSYLDLLVTQVGSGAVPTYSDAQGKVAWQPNERHTFTLLGVAGFDDVRLDDEADAYSRGFDILDAQQTQYAVGGSWKRLVGTRGYTRVTVHRSSNDYLYDIRDRFRPGAQPDSVYFSDSRETETGIRVRMVQRLAASTDLTVGAEVRHVSFVHDITAFADTAQEVLPTASPDTVRLVVSPRNDVRADDVGTKGAVFASLERRVGARFSVTAGLRWERFDYGGQDGWSPRAGVTYRLTERWTARASAGIFLQTPSYVQLTQTASTRRLPLAEADHGVVGADYRISQGAQVTIEAYLKRYRHLPVAPVRGSHELVPEGSGVVRGVELFVQQRLLDRWYGLVAYSGSRSERTDLVHGTFPDDWDYRHVFTLLVGVRPRGDLQLSGRWRAIGGRPFTAFARRFEVTPTGVVRPGTGYWVGFEGPYHGDRLPAYHRLDLRVDHRRQLDRFQLVAFLDVENVYARDNVLTQRYSHDRETPEPVYQWRLLPVVGLSLEF